MKSINKHYLSAAVIAVSLALPGKPALAQSSEIVVGISITTTGPAAALGPSATRSNSWPSRSAGCRSR
jgi:hypothetical protein